MRLQVPRDARPAWSDTVGDSATGKDSHSKRIRAAHLLAAGMVKYLGVPQTGFHAFRRFRATWLRKQSALEDLVKLWLGHAETSITDGYSKIKTDAAFRRQEAERVGIGFEISQSVSPAVRNVRKSKEAIAA